MFYESQSLSFSRQYPGCRRILCGVSHIFWKDNLLDRLVEAGYQGVVFENRDVGESQRLDEYGNPTIWWELLKDRLGFEMNAPYDLSDMPNDSIGLMDELQLERAHIVGISMGGMIAQVIAARYPERVISLTSIVSTPGFADHLPPGGESKSSAFTKTQAGETEAEANARLERSGFYRDAFPRQIMAVIKSGDRSEAVKTIRVPTLVMHGKDDTLIPIAHGEYTAELIEGSKFIAFEGMGHNMPSAVLPEIVSNMVSHMKSEDAKTFECLVANTGR